MTLFDLILIAISLSMDAFAVSICKGLSVHKVSFAHAMTCGLWFGGFQFLMPTLGFFLGDRFAVVLTNFGPWVAFVLLAIIGVIACPITSGDTAYRSARLTIADWFHIDQAKVGPRAALSVPLLAVGAVIALALPWDVLWRYFSWANQTLAMIVLWAASMYLFYEKKNYWITAVPATFMSAVSSTYFLLGNECLGRFLNHTDAAGKVVYNTAVAYPIGIAVAIVFLGIFLYTIKKRHTQPHYETLHK